MAKVKTAYVCNDCGADFMRWQGQCSECKAWNTITEVRLGTSRPALASERRGFAGITRAEVQTLADVELADVPRFSSGYGEFDCVLGGGIVPGSAILIGGSPGAGKSTLLLQVMCHLAAQMKALYVTGEESLQQVALRARRLGLPLDNLRMLAETSVEGLCELAYQEQPLVMVIDSIQVMHLADIQSAPGSVSQVR